MRRARDEDALARNDEEACTAIANEIGSAPSAVAFRDLPSF
jgi:hypothetical protein